MPLGGIDPRASRRNSIRFQSIQPVARWSSLALLVVLLAGCASGNADESRRAETREATRGAVLPEVQATNVIKEFFPPTGTPGPTMTPVATLETLTLANQIGTDNRPRNEVGSVRSGGTVYAVAELHNLMAGQTVTAIWGTLDGVEISRSIVPIDQSTSSTWIPFQWTAGGVTPGTYAVYIYVDSELLNSLAFKVT
jgi:hypothetical protein